MHELVRFPSDWILPRLRVRADVRRGAGRLWLVWALDGDRPGLLLPPPVRAPARVDHLWQKTCFECFVAPADGAAYWEINVAPTGDWNVYRFSGYREDMRREERVEGLRGFGIATAPDGEWRLTATLALDGVPELAHDALDVGLSAVLLAHQPSYRALAHPASRPDFHQRAAFTVRVPAVR
jgi:hypothetical protein